MALSRELDEIEVAPAVATGALWMHLIHPVAVKVSYVKAGTPVLAPPVAGGTRASRARS